MLSSNVRNDGRRRRGRGRGAAKRAAPAAAGRGDQREHTHQSSCSLQSSTLAYWISIKKNVKMQNINIIYRRLNE